MFNNENCIIISIIIITIVLLIIFFSVIAYYSHSKSTSNLISKDYNEILIGGSNKSTYNSKVQVISQKQFQLLDISKYYVLDKYDGINKTYEDKNIKFYYEEVKAASQSASLSQHSNKTLKFVFDIVKVRGKDITNKSYEERMKNEVPKISLRRALKK